jgi:hypothetical protein
MITIAAQCRFAIFETPLYAFAAPLSGALISFSFLFAIVDAKNKGAVSWRDRKYTIAKKQNPLP